MATNSFQDLKSKKFWVAVFAEFIGTMLLVLVACGSGGRFPIEDDDDGNDNNQTDQNKTGFNNPQITHVIKYSPSGDFVRISLSAGLTVATIIWVIAHVSGGHINPGVTIGFAVTRKISLLRAFLYMLCQTLGAVFGAVFLMLITPPGVNDSLGTVSPGKGVGLGQAFVVEMFITFVLVWVVFATCDSQRTGIGGSGPLSIGLAVAACHLWAIPYTGSGMNPARAFGSAIVSGNMDVGVHWIYWLGPLLGGMAAGLLYDLLFATNATTAKFGSFFRRMDYDDDQFDHKGRKASDPGPIQYGMRKAQSHY